MSIGIKIPGDWEKAGWKSTEVGNYQNHVLEINDEDGKTIITLWIAGSGADYRIKVGTDTRLRNSRHITRTKYEDEDKAKMRAIEFAQEYPTLKDVQEYLN